MRFQALIAALAFTAAVLPPAQAAGNVKGVVELFTSQGCSDCPPADKVLGEFINRNGVIGLAWHVDYWDYLGWKDTFSSKTATARQRGYARSVSDGVYTPQIIVNGDTVARNSNFNGSINSALSGGLPVALNVTRRGGTLSIDAGPGSGSANLYLVTYTERANVAIGRGENGGRKVDYRHAVSGAKPLGKWNGAAAKFEIPAPGKGRSCAILLQRGSVTGPGAIIGAAMC